MATKKVYKKTDYKLIEQVTTNGVKYLKCEPTEEGQAEVYLPASASKMDKKGVIHVEQWYLDTM